jgi:hypothetical protein
MISEEQALALIRQFVKDSQDEKRREDATAVLQLLQDRDTAIATLKRHFASFKGQERFWLYALAGYLFPDAEARSQFYAERIPVEDDPICRQVALRSQKLRK